MSQRTKVVGARTPVIWLLIAISMIAIAALAVGGLVIYPQLQKQQAEQARAVEAEQHYQAGLAFQNVSDWTAAENEYKQVIILDATYKDAQSRLAEVRTKSGIALTGPDGVIETNQIATDAITTIKISNGAVTRSKVNFAVAELYRPPLHGDGCNDLIVHLQAQGFNKCVYASSANSGYKVWFSTSNCSDAGSEEPNLWQKDSVYGVYARDGYPVMLKGEYEDQMPYLIWAQSVFQGGGRLAVRLPHPLSRWCAPCS